ncbi:protein transport protein SEC31 isoform X2 [Rhododendron vialii]|uniref:protein transport protein SEC31 isoform X2 n=1 Tax=Rhododendron vialii TaxID=182163 RepID=UPI00265FEFF5|nr:protein transport protein SEC31 isoform X2 [Rhododendron vialii]
MDNYNYPVSYPESGNSSPRSREIDFDHTTPWEDQTTSPNNYKVKFMCSYGGKINPRPHDNQLSYNGGETKILAVDRNIKFSALISKLLALCDAVDVSFKYQLPGEDLDALISVTNDEDLEHMMHEYDRLCKASSKPARLRLFLFPVSAAEEGSIGSSEGKSDRDRFMEALNSGPIQSNPHVPTAAVQAAAPPPPSNNVDFLFGLEKRIPVSPPLQQPAVVATKVQDPEILAPEDRVIGPDNPILQTQIQEMQRLQISSAQEQAVYRRRSEESLVEAFAGDYYAPKVPPPAVAGNIPVSAPTSYWPEKQQAGGFYQATAPFPEQQQPPPQQQVYMIPTPTGMYHAPMGRPLTGPAGQGYYAVQRMPTEVYREHQSPVYNVVPPSQAVAQPSLPPQAPSKVAGFTTAAGGVGVVDAGYNTQVAYDGATGRQVAYDGATGRQVAYDGTTGRQVAYDGATGRQVAYDGATGRQVYYAAQGGVMPPQAYQAMAAVNGDMRAAGGLNQEGKVVVKTSQHAAV